MPEIGGKLQEYVKNEKTRRVRYLAPKEDNNDQKLMPPKTDTGKNEGPNKLIQSDFPFNKLQLSEKKLTDINDPSSKNANLEKKETKVSPEIFFTNREINAKNINEYLKLQGFPTNKMAPEYSFEKSKQTMFAEIRNLGPTGTPKDLMKNICTYIRSWMGYDGLSMIGQIDAIKAMSAKPEEIDNAKLITKMFGLKEFAIQSKQWSSLHAHAINVKNKFSELEETKQIKEIKEALSSIIRITSKDRKTLTPEEQASFGNNYNFLQSLRGEYQILEPNSKVSNDILLEGIYDVGEQLYDMRVGVCRHFSMIAKLIYKEMSKGTPLEKNSENIFVVGSSKTHARNLLVREDERGEIQKQYYDITRFIGGGPLEGTADIPNNENEEIWVKNTRKTSNTIESKQIG